MAVGCGKHLEDHLGHEEMASVFRRGLGLTEYLHDGLDPRAAIGLIFVKRGCAGCLTHIFLWQSQDPFGVDGRPAIETFDNQRFAVLELANFASGDGQAVRGDDLRAKPLVFHGCAHVGLHIADASERQLENVRGRRAAMGQKPAALVPEQRGFLLRARDRQAQIVSRRGLSH